jgi:DNA-binding CsgD family transcriptional regulator
MERKKLNLTESQIDTFKKLVIKNNTLEVAKILGISRRSVYNYMNDLGIVKNHRKSKISDLAEALSNYKK